MSCVRRSFLGSSSKHHFLALVPAGRPELPRPQGQAQQLPRRWPVHQRGGPVERMEELGRYGPGHLFHISNYTSAPFSQLGVCLHESVGLCRKQTKKNLWYAGRWQGCAKLVWTGLPDKSHTSWSVDYWKGEEEQRAKLCCNFTRGADKVCCVWTCDGGSGGGAGRPMARLFPHPIPVLVSLCSWAIPVRMWNECWVAVGVSGYRCCSPPPA